MAFFQAWDFSGWKMVIFRVEFFFEAKFGDLKLHPENDHFTSLGFLGWNFKSPIFASKKFHPENGHFPSLGFFGVENGHFSGGIRPGKWPFSRLEFALENGHFPGWNLPWKMPIFQVGICAHA